MRSDLIELEGQVSQLQRELAVSERVVALADADLSQVQGLLSKAEEARVQNVGHVIRVRMDNQSLDLDAAYAKANSISQSRSAYAARAADIERDLGFLEQQRDRLSTLLTQLETERSDFQNQLFALDRQVDAIARNERMIDLMSKRQETLDRLSRYEVASLDQLTSKMADIRARQESELQQLAVRGGANTYEQQAKYQLDVETSRSGVSSTGRVRPATIEVKPPVLEITPDKTDTVTIDPDRIARND